MLEVNDCLRIPDAEFQWSFVRSSGPGGQNVNKVASKAVLRWSLAASPNIPEEVKARLRSLFPSRITLEGELIITSQLYRDQERNRADCLAKLGALIERAAHRPKVRKATRPSRSSKRRRVDAKRRHADVKKGRQRPEND